MMIRRFELVKPKEVRMEKFFELMFQLRRYALSIEGVYDLALFETEKTEQQGIWSCSVEMASESAWTQMCADVHLRQICDQLRELGVKSVEEMELVRRI
jgi:hypothetical protein